MSAPCLILVQYIKDYFVTDIGLGSGAFGLVMKAVVKTTGKQLACKIIGMREECAGDWKLFIKDQTSHCFVSPTEKRIKQNGKLVNRPRIQLDNIQREVEIHMQMQHV